MSLRVYSFINIDLIINNFEKMTKKYLNLLKLSKAQNFYIYKLIYIVIVSEDSHFIFFNF